jgi:hypothetical protein
VVASGVHSWLAAAFERVFAVGTIAFSFSLAVIVFLTAGQLAVDAPAAQLAGDRSRGGEGA